MRTGHGNDRYDYEGLIRYDFSSNIPWQNHSDEVIKHLREQLDTIQNYPDPNAKSLTELICRHHDVPPECVLVTSGSAEAFYLVAHLYEGHSSLIAIPSFREYEDAARVYRHSCLFMRYDDLGGALPLSDLLWLAYPNNPDGRLLDLGLIERLVGERDGTVIIDNAYGELTPVAHRLDELSLQYPNLITIHSLTKTFGIPGLRIGYIIASPKIIRRLGDLMIPWSVNALAQASGLYVLSHYDSLKPDTDRLISESIALQEMIKVEVPEVTLTPSVTNFFLLEMRWGTASDLKEYLISSHGILIRNADNFRGLTSRHFRLSVQHPQANQALLIGLKSYFDEKKDRWDK